jgi:hypothetical protein
MRKDDASYTFKVLKEMTISMIGSQISGSPNISGLGATGNIGLS